MSHSQPMYHGAPPSRGGNGVVIALVVAIVLAVGGFGAWWFFFRDSSSTQPASQASVQEQQPIPEPEADASASVDQAAPSETAEQEAEEPQQEPSSAPAEKRERKQEKQPKEQPSGRDNGASTPPLPQRFGEFEASGKTYENIGLYSRSDGTYITSTLFPGGYGEELIDGEERVVQSGPWTCGVSEGVTDKRAECVAEAHGRTVMLSAFEDRISLEELAAAGEDFLAAWS